jgi:hypothetical protein
VSAGGRGAPQPIEDLLRRIPIVSEATAMATGPVAILWPNAEVEARALPGIPTSDFSGLSRWRVRALRREIDARSAAHLRAGEAPRSDRAVAANGEITPSPRSAR